MGRELHILLIFMLLILAIVFCHSFVRFILAVARGPSHRRSHIPSRSGPRGYAEPDQPIPVVLAADEEIMAESAREKLASPPPAYGLWRSSVVSINLSICSFVQERFVNCLLTENQPRPAALATCKRVINTSKNPKWKGHKSTPPELCIR